MKFIVLLTLVFIGSSAALGQAAESLESTEVRETLGKYDQAWNRKDVKVVDEILDDGYVYFSSTGTPTDRRSSLEFLAKPDYKLTFVKRSELKLHSFDGKVAIVSSRWQGKGSWSGGEINDDQRCGQVLVKKGKKWRLVSEHCVQIVDKE